MNRTLIAKEFKAIKWKLLVGFLMLVAVILVMIAMYENMQDLIPPNITEQVPFITAEMLAILVILLMLCGLTLTIKTSLVLAP